MVIYEEFIKKNKLTSKTQKNFRDEKQNGNFTEKIDKIDLSSNDYNRLMEWVNI